MSEQQRLLLSPTVRRMRKSLEGKSGGVYAVDIVSLILERHPDYAKKVKLPKLKGTSDGVQKHVDEWLAEVRSLFDPELAHELHGKLVIIGLSILEHELKQQLDVRNFLDALTKELKEPIEGLFTRYGYEKWNARKSEPESDSDKISGSVTDTVRNHSDNALDKMTEDQLGRAAYGRYLARRILAVQSNKAFAIHIYGPWGAGKSTLLNFLRDELEKDEWMVVEFNAWRNQHITPPWWALLDRVFQDSKRYLSSWNLARENGWRLSMGRAYYFFGLFLALLFFTGILYFIDLNSSNGAGTFEYWVGVLKNAGAILTTAVAVWAAFLTVSRSLVWRSAEAAESYIETSTDPMGQIACRFKTLISRIKNNGKNKRVAIFIDDLDRCQSDYVVKLLEGIQTLFREAPVIFVVAADQRWLNACFEEVHNQLEHHIQEPGKHLGTLFLEKVFQFSAPVPGIPPELRNLYWQHLLQKTNDDPAAEMGSARSKAKTAMDNAKTEDKMLFEIKQSNEKPFAERQAIREELIVRLASPELSANIKEHTLDPFAALLEPNPRSMKRLVNAYSVNRALSTLGHLDIPSAKLALWTILAMRWPELARHLEEHPKDIERIRENGKQETTTNDVSIDNLYSDPEVINVVNGEKSTVQLDLETVKQCALLRM